MVYWMSSLKDWLEGEGRVYNEVELLVKKTENPRINSRKDSPPADFARVEIDSPKNYAIH